MSRCEAVGGDCGTWRRIERADYAFVADPSGGLKPLRGAGQIFSSDLVRADLTRTTLEVGDNRVFMSRGSDLTRKAHCFQQQKSLAKIARQEQPAGASIAKQGRNGGIQRMLQMLHAILDTSARPCLVLASSGGFLGLSLRSSLRGGGVLGREPCPMLGQSFQPRGTEPLACQAAVA